MSPALCRLIATWLIGCALSAPVAAHVASNGFLSVAVTEQSLAGAVEIAVRDVEMTVGADADRDSKVTWGELHAAEPRLIAYLEQHIAFTTQQRVCEVAFHEIQINERVDGVYAWAPFTAHCPVVVRDLTIGYTVLQGLDPSHRGLLTLSAGTFVQTAVLRADEDHPPFTVMAASRWNAFVEYLQAGIWHIWSGIDHLLFLISLLLPAVLLRRGREWQPVAAVRPAFVSILKVVTAFTVAHSLTLTLAALDVVRLPSRLTESVIAASIIVAALNNVYPIVTEHRARIAFAFGLLHGFGFASVLADMGLPSGARLVSLLAFNCGIEVGQLAVVVAVMPVIYWLRDGTFYRRTVMPWGSAAIAMLALFWLVQRVTQ